MTRSDLTDLQLRQLVAYVERAAAGRAGISNIEAGQIRRIVGELQELRSREAVTRHLSQLEGVY